MSSEVVHVETRVRGRCLVRPPLAAPAAGAPTVLGFHGYGEDAAPMLARLASVPGSERWLLAAPQALHPFYTRSGEVVASWMTRLDRELAIADNVAYVRATLAALRARYGQPGAGGALVVAGFSQGVAMAYRAVALAGEPAAALVVVAGVMPPELREDAALASLPPVLLARGSEESWYTPEKEAADLAALRRAGVAVRHLGYAGGHQWTAEVSAAVAAFVDERAAAASSA
jgi:predicted esterase